MSSDESVDESGKSVSVILTGFYFRDKEGVLKVVVAAHPKGSPEDIYVHQFSGILTHITSR